jgi:hypothetical protein
MQCTCSVSQGPSAVIAVHSDFRFDVPQGEQIPQLESSVYIPLAQFASLIAGYASPPELPPKSIL